MFQVIIAMKATGGPYTTFEDAFRKLYEETCALIKQGVARQILETACFITYAFTSSKRVEYNTGLSFYDSIDLAHQVGILSDDGTLVEVQGQPAPIADIQNTFIQKTAREIVNLLELRDDVEGIKRNQKNAEQNAPT